MYELKNAVKSKTWLLRKLIRIYEYNVIYEMYSIWIGIFGDFKHMILTVGLPHCGQMYFL